MAEHDSVTTRARLEAPGADAVLDDFQRHRKGAPDGVAAARALTASCVRWEASRDPIVASGRSVVLADRPGGAVLVARHFRPGEATTIHDHGSAGAALVVEGRHRYERYGRAGAGTARLESVHDLAVGDVAWWDAPPDDLHRQVSAGGAIELVLLAGPIPWEAGTYTDVTDEGSARRRAFERGFLDGDVTALAPWYAADVLGDLNVPQWRFQVRGRTDLLDLLRDEEFTQPDRRLSHLRLTDTADGLLIETESRFREGGEARLFREVHHLRCRDGLVVEHVVWCSGIYDAAAIARQAANAPMERM